MTLTKAPYQPEIDGLRAIAVLGVLLFHLDANVLPGGFVGVDVFFVISGFLISRLIVNEVNQTGSFNFGHFYLRRIRRLFPALFFTVALCLLFSVVLFPPEALERIGASALYVLFSISNFFFWSEVGYFDIAAAEKPLLHTWSLSVEEQFYLVWPLTLVLLLSLTRHRKSIILLGLLLLGTFSLAASEYLLEQSPSTVFFMTPFRLFEFALGAALVWAPVSSRPSGAREEVLLLLGLGLIFGSMALLQTNDPFPGLYVLPPTLGAAMSIYACRAKFLGILLRNKIAVFIGLISYSLYLVHWPLIVFYTYGFNTEIEFTTALGLGLVSIASAVLMYRYVETPFRQGQKSALNVSPGRLIAAATLCTVLLISTAALLTYSKGWPARLEGRLPDNIDIASVPKSGTWARIRDIKDQDFADDGRTRLLIVGDSQAADLVTALDIGLSKEEYQLVSRVTYARCGALFVSQERRESYFEENWQARKHERLPAIKRSCNVQWRNWQTSAALSEADYILLSSHWHDYHLPFLADTISFIRSRSNASIIIVGNKALPIGSQPIATRCALLSFLLPTECNNSLATLNQFAASFLDTSGNMRGRSYLAVSKSMRDIVADSGARYLDMHKLVCGTELDACTIYNDQGIATFKNGSHINNFGAQMLAERLATARFPKHFPP